MIGPLRVNNSQRDPTSANTTEQALVVFTRGDQKVRGKVLLNRIAFIDCNENS